MTEMYKIVSGKYDTAVTPRVTKKHSYIMRGNDRDVVKCGCLGMRMLNWVIYRCRCGHISAFYPFHGRR